ncbi:nucleoside hydrolase, partial [Dietzia sp. SLG310A2-38A2]|uniref:nucleoside hydrolase n=1 Tax=Dietzia sp. SLG310A2-38A2 TaxID=1630643 RepID=UPI0015FD4571
GAAGAIAVPHVFTPETHGPRGAGHAELPTTTRSVDPRDGARLWVDAAHAHPGELVGIVTGPSSTLAHALALDPALPGLLARVVVMGGAFRGHPGNTTPVSEWNVDVDPEAADRVCRVWEDARAADPAVGAPLWCGLDLTERAVWTPERSEQLLAASGSPLVRTLIDALRFYFEFHESVGEGYLAQVHDPLVAWLALHPEAALTEPVHLRIECAGEHTRGMTVEDRRGHRGRPANAELVVDLSFPGGAVAVLEEVTVSIAALR